MAEKKAKDTLLSENPSSWDCFNSTKHKKDMEKLANDYITYISENKTEREVVADAVRRAKDLGLEEGKINDNGAVFTLYGKAICIVKKGKEPLSNGIRLIGSHADSPRLDLKQHPFVEQCEVLQAKTHYYGGIRKYHWFSTPLSLHGAIAKKDGSTVNVSIGDDDNDPVFVVSDLLPHLARKQEMKKPVAEMFEAEKMNLIIGHTAKDNKEENPIKKNILEIINKKYGVVEDDFYSAEMQVVPAGKARYIGFDKSLIGGYGQDDRICCFTSLEAFAEIKDPQYTTVLVMWDKEEIGSDGATGAKSHFFENCIRDIRDAWEKETPFRDIMRNTKALSSDVKAAMHPDYPEVYDKNNGAILGHGPIFSKFSGHGGKYSGNEARAEYVAFLRNMFDEAGLPWQLAEMGKVDIGGGGTIAKFLAKYSMDIIDFGPGLLGMHSPFEVSSKVDLYTVYLAYKEFLK